ncbi:MAG TPA: ribonucleoside-diphosphate reductase subunit alpha [Vicinamibacterales bacterium]|nr:ribonucleoside-diphosphate reductase subunit alpha [Vicinamibacterales bacterium]
MSHSAALVSSSPAGIAAAPPPAATPALYVIRRNGTRSPWDATKIAAAVTKAFLAVEGEGASGSTRVHEVVAALTRQVAEALERRSDGSRALHIEDIQDQVELALMRAGHHKVARAYVLYRESRAEARRAAAEIQPRAYRVRQADGRLVPLDREAWRRSLEAACRGLASVSADRVLEAAAPNIYDEIAEADLMVASTLAARALIDRQPEYTYVSARLLLASLAVEALGFVHGEAHTPMAFTVDRLDEDYRSYFPAYVRRAVDLELAAPELASFDLGRLATAIRPERDLQFQLLGLQTLYDRYFLHHDGVRFELPQAFFMRVAMGLALNESDREARAVEFYDLLSSFDFMCSTPTLFNAGTRRPQLSSCFLTTVSDDLPGIFKAISDNALLSKYAGGLGNDWTRVRGLGAAIKGTNGRSQGVVPFLKIANDTAIAVNQGGKRKGAVCAYLEVWHVDIEEFLDLRKNTGDDRRRTHDMHTAAWIPDLFMQRVEADAEWTLFSPDEVPDLHDRTGRAFAEAYVAAEARADRGELRVFRRLRAVDLWRRLLTMLFETGHPWVTFKDACNLRSPQQHAGVVHSSNLCTEITLNTSDDEVAVCNLGSINLAAHVTPEGLDEAKLARTVATAVRMLDNVIDVNFYTIPEARQSNMRHRPVGLGLMGFQDALHTLRVPYASDAAVAFADTSMEAIAFHAIAASADLAVERGRYTSFDGSLWSQGVLPIDSLDRLAAARDPGDLDVDRSHRLDWDALRTRVRTAGLRHSNIMAIAPTATISNICGVSPSIEPTFQNLYVKANMSGNFTVVNHALVRDLEARGLWDDVMVNDLKYYDGSLASIARVPRDLAELYATAFEIDPEWLIRAGARRQKWIDQAQSLNLYVAEPSGRQLDAIYRLAWRSGLKTTYYLRSRGATHVERSTLDAPDRRLNAVAVPPSGAACALGDPNCEACQ